MRVYDAQLGHIFVVYYLNSFRRRYLQRGDLHITHLKLSAVGLHRALVSIAGRIFIVVPLSRAGFPLVPTRTLMTRKQKILDGRASAKSGSYVTLAASE